MRILDNMPEADEEKTPDELRIDALVDPLPFVKGANWKGVNVERFVPLASDTRDVHRADSQRADEKAARNERPADVKGAPPKELPPGGIMQFGGGEGGPENRRRADKTRRPEPPLLMIRQFDFSVESGRTYRYRARLVIWDIRGRRKEVARAWSETTGSVTVL